MHRTYRQPLVGKRLRVLRENSALSRADVANATGVSASALVRLESGDDVRMSTYLRVIDHFLERTPEAWMVADRFVALDDKTRARVIELIQWFTRHETTGGEHE